MGCQLALTIFELKTHELRRWEEQKEEYNVVISFLVFDYSKFNREKHKHCFSFSNLS